MCGGKNYPGEFRGGHRHLQIGRMLDIDLISEPPTPPRPRCMSPKCGNLCGQRGRKRFIASWGLRISHICPNTPCPSPQKGRGQRSKVVILPTTAGDGLTEMNVVGGEEQMERGGGRQKPEDNRWILTDLAGNTTTNMLL